MIAAEHNNTVVEHGTGQKTLTAYVVGLLSCILLTITAFVVVGQKLFATNHIFIVLAILAVIQLFVQSICFLRLNCSAEGRWNLLPFIFTIFVIATLVVGSLWIMYNINFNMMS